MIINKKKFVYLISPSRILNNKFYKDLELTLRSGKVSFFQLRLKKEKLQKKIFIGKKIRKICKKYKVKFLINDSPILAQELNADGCHLGQNDMKIDKARKIIKKKIIGITCHNSLKLAKLAIDSGADYVAFGTFNTTKTKKTKFKATNKILNSFRKISKKPVVAIGGINNLNYKKLLLNNVNFLAISSYIWKNKNYKPEKAIKELR